LPRRFACIILNEGCGEKVLEKPEPLQTIPQPITEVHG